MTGEGRRAHARSHGNLAGEENGRSASTTNNTRARNSPEPLLETCIGIPALRPASARPAATFINLRAAVKGNPVDLESRVYLAATLMAAGDASGARWEADEIQSLEPGFSAGGWLRTYPMTDVDQKKRLLALLGEAGF